MRRGDDAASAAGEGPDGVGGGVGTRPRSDSAASSSASTAATSSSSGDAGHNAAPGRDREAGSSRLFQPHRTLGLLTSPAGGSGSSLFRANAGRLRLQAPSRSSDESFATVPLGDRFQILTVSKLVPVLVSRALPPSAGRHRRRRRGGGKGGGEKGGDEEEMHAALSDSSLGVTVATHGPASSGRAVSVTMYARTRPVASLDAFPFAPSGRGERWGVVDAVPLGRQRVAMGGEKEGRTENTMLIALVCARSDRVADSEGGSEGEDDVHVVGSDSSDDSDGDGGTEDDDSDDGSDGGGSAASTASGSHGSVASVDGAARPPPEDCRGRVLVVQASRTAMEIVRVVDLAGTRGAGFVPRVGLHPATYVNKVLLGGGRDGDADGGGLLLVNVRTGKMIHSFGCLSGEMPPGAVVTSMAQSPAVDTVAVGTSDGSVHLVNALHDLRLFTLRHGPSKGMKSRSNGGGSAVTSLSFRTDGNASRQGVAPLAVGCDDGSISVWDLTPVEDEATGTVRRTLMTRMDGAHHGGVSGASYLPGEPLLLSSGRVSNAVVLHVFDAPDGSGRVLRQRRGHVAPPRLVRYLHPGLAGGGVLAGAADGTDASSCQILSCGGAGDRSLRLFSAARSNLDKEYSQGRGLERTARRFGKAGPDGRAELLLPEIVGLASSEARSRDWGDLVTIHADHAMAYVWSTKRGAQSGPVLRQPDWNVSAMAVRPPRSCNATAVAVSSCGNFAVVGTAGGVCYRYNLQSGLPRGSYPRDATSPTEEEERKRKKGLRFAGDVGRTTRMLERSASKHGGASPSDADAAERDRRGRDAAESRRAAAVDRASHVGAVVGIAVDSLNRTMVTAGSDSKLVLWNFATRMPHRKSPIGLPSPATRMCHVRDTDLAAIAMSDYSVAVFDCSSLSVVRMFRGGGGGAGAGHGGTITDLGFGPDGRRLFTSSMDGTVRVWDVPTGVCVDWMSFSSPPTSLALSPTGEFLATSHAGRLGISLWCDKSYFRMVHLDGSPGRPSDMNEPCPVAECEDAEIADDGHAAPVLPPPGSGPVGPDGDGEVREEGGGPPPEAKDEGLITLSGLPPAHWKNLFRLELVRERNRPTEAPAKPAQAPFFLQWRGGPDSSSGGAEGEAGPDGKPVAKPADGDDGWDAAWSDDESDGGADGPAEEPADDAGRSGGDGQEQPAKRRRVAIHRSKLADLLLSCRDGPADGDGGPRYSRVTSYLSTMGPSSIDVEISSLCHGPHDLEDGLPLLLAASRWLLEACRSGTSFEAVNAYLHRFLRKHGGVVVQMGKGGDGEGDGEGEEEEAGGKDGRRDGVEELLASIELLRREQQSASDRLQGKMQHTICLLRHLSRMV